MERPVYERCRAAIPIRAAREAVWRALVQETAAWWPRDYHVGGPDTVMRVEARPGGRWYEDAGHDEGVLWFTVVAIKSPERLDLAGYLLPGFGGPGTAFLRLILEEKDGKTILHLTDSLVGGGEVPREAVAEGYEALFGQALRSYCED